jgi:hypothetical protein
MTQELNFIEIFKRVCSERETKCSIIEQQAANDFLYTCQRGSVGFEFYIEMEDNQPYLIQYRLHNEDLDGTEYERDPLIYHREDHSYLNEEDYEECILQMLEDVNERYEIEIKFRKLLNKVFAQVENEDDLFILKELFNIMCDEF